MKKIVLYIRGGLGNQLFQYAAAYCYAKNNNREIVVDIESYHGYRWDKDSAFILDRLIHNININNSPLWSHFFTIGSIGVYLGRFLRKIFWQSGNVHREKELFVFDNSFFLTKNYDGLYGSFQSPLYFELYRNDIVSLFRFPLISKESKKLKRMIKDTPSPIAVHYRDYSDPLSGGDDIKILMGDISNNYYEEAMSLFDKQVDRPVYFIFSNNISSAKSKFNEINSQVVYFDYKSKYIWEDMVLMSLCEHNIICNSSYSWWAAYLNDNKNKVVVAPKDWGNLLLGKSNNNLFPKSWKLI